MSIAMLLDMAASSYDSRTALGREADGISYESLRRTVAGGAGLIRASAAGSVAFIGLNGPAFPSLLMASAVAGVPFSPLNYRLSPAGLAELLARLDRPLVVVDEAFEHAVGDQVMTAGAWLSAARVAEEAPPADVADEDCAVLLFTSGTTGRPKGVVLRHENLVSYVIATVEFASADPEEAVLVSVPPYHVAAIGSALTSLYAGRRMVYLPNFDPAAWLGVVAREKVTGAMVVPTMLARIVDELGETPAEVPTLRSIAYGGARMPVTVLERALRLFPEAGFVNAYGLTETSSTIAVLTPEDHREALGSDDPAVPSASRWSSGVSTASVELVSVRPYALTKPASGNSRSARSSTVTGIRAPP